MKPYTIMIKTIIQKIKKKIKKRIYKGHKLLAYITFIPVVLWCFSGITHPFMAHFFKPQIKNEWIEPKVINIPKIQVSLKEILRKEKIETFKNFRFIEMNNDWFYQIKLIDNSLVYFSATNGKKIEKGDEKYAQYLAQYFLEDYQSKILKVEYLTEFDHQYKYINRYLPVYKITFDRSDNMQVYVETTSSKLATFNPLSRQVFIWFFDTFHNWSFLDAITTNEIRIILMIILLGTIIASALSGIIIYGFFWKIFKKTQISSENKTRIHHRKLGIWFSLLTIGFAFSGAFHLTKKWNPKPVQDMVYEPVLNSNKIKINPIEIAVNKTKLQNVSLIQFEDTIYYRCQLQANFKSFDQDKSKKEKKKLAPVADVVYLNAQSNTLAKGLDLKYAEFLAHYFENPSVENAPCCENQTSEETKTCGIDSVELLEIKVLTDFDNREYGFVNKRLPVVKLAYNTPEKTTYFVETATSRIASVIQKTDRTEGYSFAILHKFLWMDWAGKPIRDLVMTFAAITLLILTFLGIKLLIKKE
ncbi:PepSY domain-containing protein [Flavobacterium columnare]|nr:PepSY domain-containing protein [Flavobacterium columnare]QOG91652.1 PepSY domain-containing protein [Flavobacterium columnare]QOG94315.1 PepSY domain-containing protein [Flavobacterium columnare]QOG96974.1 PepSY domain-containing protein [Flavobacterium columnare]QOG99632.1 PepSY domain-containing protein [Flavobacterium columnare]